MVLRKLSLGEFDEIDYNLIAIHTSLEDYRLAYFLNQRLGINLSKSANEIQISVKEGETNFSRFSYTVKETNIRWNLIQNNSEVMYPHNGEKLNLFFNVPMQMATKVFLLPEFKKVDYFLKIENNDEISSTTETLILINSIESISTVYIVDAKKIKSKNNLIF
ncbi:hypothetical protein SAMN05444372_101366 [Flavobacterium micromati]|uniref:IPExxxVDY family protein n=1 Tax=Flavobacterium micromati TaxID=229205 RepID=A0A1M5FYW4_9FLAO|nr:IPExxxVDY family protein [Flavobacterium micromati]SHF96666.1 hypothetical protein SAMN05444372_101366 [Flavobacterium micromati]